MFERLSSPELHWCWNESRLVKLLVFCLLSRKFGQSFFVCVSFVSFYKQAKSVLQQMRNCVCKTQTATTGTRPPLVASQYNSLNSIKEICISLPSRGLKGNNLLLSEQFFNFKGEPNFGRVTSSNKANTDLKVYEHTSIFSTFSTKSNN